MGYLFYKGKQYADEVLVDQALNTESGHAIANKVVANNINTINDELDALDSGKQATLISGQTIKTINNQSVLGSGNIDIQGGSYIAGSGITIQNNTISINSETQTTIAGKEESSNKTTTITSSSTNAQYPSAKAVWDTEQDIKEIAEGKTKSFVCSSVTNPVLNSQAATVVITEDLTDTRGNIIHVTDFKIGDNVYIPELDVPDRWCGEITNRIPAVDTNGSSTQTGTPSPANPIVVTSTKLKDASDNDVELRGINTFIDTYTANNTTIKRKIGVYTMTGNESFTDQIPGMHRCFFSPPDILTPPASASSSDCMSTIGVGDTSGTVANTNFIYGGRFYFVFDNGVTFPTLASFTTYLTEQYELGTPVKIYYPLQTETTEIKPLFISSPTGVVILHKLETAKVPVTDVQLNGTSVVSNTIANIIAAPACTQTTAGNYRLRATVTSDGTVTYSWVAE